MPPVLALCAAPSPTTVFAGSSFSMHVQPSEVNVGGSANLALGTLPGGITTASGSVALPSTGVTLHLSAATSTAAGNYYLRLNGTAGAVSATADFNFTVSTGAPPSFFFASPIHNEVGVPIGGSGSIQYQSVVNSSGSVDYDVTPSASGLPPGTSAAFTPSVFGAGESVTVTLSAARTAPVTQNALVSLTGTPTVTAASSASASFYADVTQPPGSLPGNRTDYVATAGTPYAAVYDVKHDLIFASNPYWNRVDVISNSNHKIMKQIPVLSPRGLDITQDNNHVWVITASQNIFEIDTTTFHANRFVLPKSPVNSSGGPFAPINPVSDKVLALSDGTLFLYFNESSGLVDAQAGIWNPQTNQITALVSGQFTYLGVPVRSGDGTRVYAPNNSTYLEGMRLYTVGSQSFSTLSSGTAFPAVVAVNQDGTRLVLGYNSLALYDGNLNLIGSLPGSLPTFGYGFPLSGGVVFNSDATRLFENAIYNGKSVVLTIDSSTLKVSGAAPASPAPPATNGTTGNATPFAVDSAGIVIGLQSYGVSFDDAAAFQTYAVN
jgi:hypothetical protein